MTQVGEALRDSAILNLSGAETMVVDDSPFALGLTVQALRGFGAKVRHACTDPVEAMQRLQEDAIDLLIVDCEMPGMDGYDLVRWLRRSELKPNAFVPVIMTGGHVRRTRVLKARDCGANFMVTKPFSPLVLLERIVWAARDERPFLQVGDYFGPDRRFRDDGPPGDERRAGALDLAATARSEGATA